jgi:hypothetical protein
VTLGSSEDDGGICVELSDDTLFTPELASDLLRRAADTALRLHHELHPAEPKG